MSLRFEDSTLNDFEGTRWLVFLSPRSGSMEICHGFKMIADDLV